MWPRKYQAFEPDLNAAGDNAISLRLTDHEDDISRYLLTTSDRFNRLTSANGTEIERSASHKGGAAARAEAGGVEFPS